MIFAYSPFRSQERPGRPNGASGTLKKAQQGPMRGPRGVQQGPKRGPRGRQDAQEGSKTAPRGVPRGDSEPTWLGNPSGTPLGPLRGPISGPNWGPKGVQDPLQDPSGTPSDAFRCLEILSSHDCANAGFDISGGRQPQRAENGEGLPSDTKEMPRRPNRASVTLKRAHETS